MDAALASYQARLATFQAPPAAKGRRTSSRSKKAATKPKASWPLKSPSLHDLAYAGFVWKPTSASPDNVQCFSCECQLDGWEESDIPAYEHLTHSPSCGFAVNTCIRLRTGDPGRTEDDPMCDAMLKARHDTFVGLWPLDANEGFPTIEAMAAAGWYYDPSEETPDGVTCPYCSLSLDAWDAGDNPMEEHRRRSEDCLFFVLSELYKKPPPAPPKKGKRASARSSTASTASKKATRGKKRTSEALDETEYSEVLQPPSKRLRSSSIESFPSDLPIGTPKRTPPPFAENAASSFEMSSLPADLLVGTPKKTPPMIREAEDLREVHAWQPADVDALFASQENAQSLMNDILIDAGLDKIATAGTSPEDLYAAVMAGLTDLEKTMTIEQWVLYNAKRGEEKLRMECERQIMAFEAEGRRAMALLEAISTI
jgi:hypothetical protein